MRILIAGESQNNVADVMLYLFVRSFRCKYLSVRISRISCPPGTNESQG